MPSAISPVVGKIYTRRACILKRQNYELWGGYSFATAVFAFLGAGICFHHDITLMGFQIGIPLAALTAIALVTTFYFLEMATRWTFTPLRTIWKLYDLSGEYIDLYSALRQIHWFRQRLTRREVKMFLDILEKRLDDDDDDDDGSDHKRLKEVKKNLPLFGLFPGMAFHSLPKGPLRIKI